MGKEIELLAPARDYEVAKAAIAAGADAVYIGAPSHSARSAASVTIDDIKRTVEAAHPFGVRVYVALNTLVYENELSDVERMIWDIYRAGADALIIQDLGITELDLPPIALHASTQCDIRTPEKALWLQSLGFTRIVPARELSLDELEEIHRIAPELEIEEFVHGALCVCYSGDCRASYVMTGRSGNRGECSQICRHSFTLTDGTGREILKDKYLLSLKDLNRSAQLNEMLRAGVTSFKIEGRLKDANYVMETTGYYRQLLDRIINENREEYERSSFGISTLKFEPNPAKAFNRGFTTYFTTGHKPGGMLRMATIDTTGFIGEPVGRVHQVGKNGGVKVKLKEGISLENGDGIGWRDSSTGKTEGMRVNRVEKSTIFAAPGTKRFPKAGTELFRTTDRRREKILEGKEAAIRKISLEGKLGIANNGSLALELKTESGIKIVKAIDIAKPEKAERPQKEQRLKTLSKTGDSIYSLTNLEDEVGELFIPASSMSTLKREAIELLVQTSKSTYRYPAPGIRKAIRLPENVSAENVANSLSRKVFEENGASEIGLAIECRRGDFRNERLMTTRYCLRREFGKCLRTTEGKKWQDPLYLQDSSGKRMRVEFDCKKCEMKLFNDKQGVGKFNIFS